MKRIPILSLLFFILCFPLFGQQAWMEKSINELPIRNELGTSATDESSLQFITAFVKKQIPNLRDNGVSMRLEFQNTSPIGEHFYFIQTWNGIDIYGSEIKINISKTGKVMSFYEKTANTKSWNFSTGQAPDTSKLSMTLEDIHRKIYSIREVIFIGSDANPSEAWNVEYIPDNSGKTGSMVIDRNYKILFQASHVMHYRSTSMAAHDSLVRAKVFLPDPLTTANRNYGTPYKDFSDSAVAELDFQRKDVMITAQYDKSPSGKDSFYLMSPYVQIVDNQAPYTGLTWRSTPLFDFNRHQPGFEDVNAFYHINIHQKHIQSLGITNLGNYKMQVDAHGGTDDNSSFTEGTLNKKEGTISFGTGGVDDAEDADVIIHEYTHGICTSASPGTYNAGIEERQAAEEGFCDYFACSYSKMLSSNQWQRCFNWDGHNEFWPGRSCASSKKYPNDKTGDPHVDAEIVSAPLMEIADDISRDTTDQLMLLAMYSLTGSMTMSQIMHEVVLADSAKYNGRHANIIMCHLTAHGLDSQLCKTGIEENNMLKAKLFSSYFANDGILYLHFNEAQTGRLSLYSMDGKIIFSTDFHTQVNLTFNESKLAPGLYILHVSTQNTEQAIKVLKL